MATEKIAVRFQARNLLPHEVSFWIPVRMYLCELYQKPTRDCLQTAILDLKKNAPQTNWNARLLARTLGYISEDAVNGALNLLELEEELGNNYRSNSTAQARNDKAPLDLVYVFADPRLGYVFPGIIHRDYIAQFKGTLQPDDYILPAAETEVDINAINPGDWDAAARHTIHFGKDEGEAPEEADEPAVASLGDIPDELSKAQEPKEKKEIQEDNWELYLKRLNSYETVYMQCIVSAGEEGNERFGVVPAFIGQDFVKSLMAQPNLCVCQAGAAKEKGVPLKEWLLQSQSLQGLLSGQMDRDEKLQQYFPNTYPILRELESVYKDMRNGFSYGEQIRWKFISEDARQKGTRLTSFAKAFDGLLAAIVEKILPTRDEDKAQMLNFIIRHIHKERNYVEQFAGYYQKESQEFLNMFKVKTLEETQTKFESLIQKLRNPNENLMMTPRIIALMICVFEWRHNENLARNFPQLSASLESLAKIMENAEQMQLLEKMRDIRNRHMHRSGPTIETKNRERIIEQDWNYAFEQKILFKLCNILLQIFK